MTIFDFGGKTFSAANDCPDHLPSRFQLGDVVRVRSMTGMVSGVCFREAKVFYEVGGVMHASDDVTEPLRSVIG